MTAISDWGDFRYTTRFDRHGLDKSIGMAGLPGIPERDQRAGEDAQTVGAAQESQSEAGMFRLRAPGK